MVEVVVEIVAVAAGVAAVGDLGADEPECWRRQQPRRPRQCLVEVPTLPRPAGFLVRFLGAAESTKPWQWRRQERGKRGINSGRKQRGVTNECQSRE